MRRVWWILILIIAMMGGVAAWHHMQTSMHAYETFTGRHLHVRFDYPKGWTVRESKSLKATTGHVQIFGPRREDLKYNLYIDVTLEPLALGGRLPTLEAAVQRALAQRTKLPHNQVLEQRPTHVAGEPAIRTATSYSLPLPLEAARRKMVEFRELAAYCVHDGQLIRLAYAAPAEDFEQNRHAFDRLVKTFTFLQ